MEIIVALLLLLGLSILLGELAERFRIPGIVGNIIAGILLGPMLLNVIHPTTVLDGISTVSLFFIILLIGIEVTTELLTNHLKSATKLALSSFVIPVVAMIAGTVLFFNVPLTQSIVLSVALAVPSISIISVLILRYKLNKYDDGISILAGVVVADVLAFVVLALVNHSHIISLTLLGILLFFGLLLLIDKEVRKHSSRIRKFFNSASATEHSEDLIFAAVIILGLIVASILQFIGITYVLGAFFAGMLIHKSVTGKRLYGQMRRTFRRLNNSFFIPVFFSIAGLSVQLPKFHYFVLLLYLLLISAVVGGILDYFVAKRMMKIVKPRTTSALLGSRGAVGVVIAAIALSEGIINTDFYSLIIFGTMVLSLIMPALMDLKGIQGRHLVALPE